MKQKHYKQKNIVYDVSGDKIWEILGRADILLGIGGLLVSFLLIFPKLIKFIIKNIMRGRNISLKYGKNQNRYYLKTYIFKNFRNITYTVNLMKILLKCLN